MSLNDTSLTNELRKLRKENTDLKLKNEQLERKEMVYAQKFMRAKTFNNTTEHPNQNDDHEIDDLINKYNTKNDELNAKLIIITEKLNTFINEKNFYQNYKEESLMYKKKYEETEIKLNDLQNKYNQLINYNENKKKNLNISLNERFTINSQKNSNISELNNNNINQINRNLKNEIMYEIKEVLGNHNIYFPYRGNTNNTFNNNQNNNLILSQSIDSSNNYSLNIGDKVKTFDKMSIKFENDLNGNVNDNDFFDYNIDLSNIINEKDLNENKININFNKKYNDENIKEIIKQKNNSLIPFSMISNGKSKNSYKGFCKILKNLISYVDNNLNSNTEFLRLNNKGEKLPSFSKDNYYKLNIKLTSLDIPNPLKIITYTDNNNSIIDYLTNNFLSVCVISLLSQSNINLLNKIIHSENNILKHSFPLIVIHNLNNFSKKIDVEYYINHYLLKCINGKNSEIKKTYMLTMKDLYDSKNKNQLKNYWYYHQKTKIFENIIHLIYTNDGSESGQFYNFTTIQFLYSYIKEKGNVVLKNNNYYSIKTNIIDFYKQYLNEKNNNELDKKDSLENNENVPEYSYILKHQEKILLLIIDICDLIDDLNINIEIQDKNHVFEISGKRVLKEIYNNQDNNQNIFNNRWNGSFILNFNIPSNILKKVNFSIKYQNIFYRDGSIFIQFGKI